MKYYFTMIGLIGINIACLFMPGGPFWWDILSAGFITGLMTSSLMRDLL